MDHDLRKRVLRTLGREDSSKKIEHATTSPSGASFLRFQMWCAATGKPFVVVAFREGDHTLRMLRNELPGDAATGTGNGRSGDKPTLLGSFDFDTREWPGCPHCGTVTSYPNPPGSMWQCDKTGCGGPFHCGGSRNGLFRCACGIVERPIFTPVDSFPVRGAANTPESANALGRSAREVLTAPANARLTFKEK